MEKANKNDDKKKESFLKKYIKEIRDSLIKLLLVLLFTVFSIFINNSIYKCLGFWGIFIYSILEIIIIFSIFKRIGKNIKKVCIDYSNYYQTLFNKNREKIKYSLKYLKFLFVLIFFSIFINHWVYKCLGFWGDFIFSIIEIVFVILFVNKIKNSIKPFYTNLLDYSKNIFEEKFIFLKDKFIIIVIFLYSIIFNLLLFCFIKSRLQININKNSSGIYSNILFESLLCFIIGILFLKSIKKIKNKYYEKGSSKRLITDGLYILNFIFIFYFAFSKYNCQMFLSWSKIFLENINFNINSNIEELTHDYLRLIEFYARLYILFSLIGKLKKDVKGFVIFSQWSISLFIIITILGLIDIQNLGLLTLICTIMSQFMSYDNIKYLYGKLSKVDYNIIDEEKTQEQISFVKFSINFIIIFLYFYIVLTEGIKIPKIVDSETVEISLLQYIWDNIHKYIFNTSIIIPSFFWKGIIRFGILYILLVIITSCIYIFYLFKIALYSIIIFLFSKIFKNDKKKLEYSEKKKKENEKKYIQYELILKKYLKKYLKKNIIRVKRYIEMNKSKINKSKINKTKIKTSIHINSRKKSRRLYKYKNIEFHNKKPNSN